MKLYEIPRGSKLNLECSDGSKYITFNRIDGMYGHCESEKGSIVHLNVSTKLKKEDDNTYSITK